MSEITVASREQSAGIEQVNHAIIEMDDATQQNAALVEQAAAAAQSMQDQAATLAKMVDTFKVDGAGMPAPAAAAVRVRAKPARPSAAPVPVRVARPARLPATARLEPTRADSKADDWEEF